MRQGISIFKNDFSSTSEIFLLQLFEGLKSKHQVEFLVFAKGNDRGYTRKFNIYKLAKPYSIKFMILCIPLSLRYKVLNIKVLYYIFLLERARFDKIYFPFLYMLLPFKKALPLFCKQYPQKHIFTSIRGTEVTVNPYTKNNYLIDCQSILNYVNKLHFLSEKLKTQYIELGFPEKQNMIIYQGVDKVKFGRNLDDKWPNDYLRILTIGRFNYIKGIEFLILACHHLSLDGVNYRCSIVGYGPEKEKYEYMIHDLNLKNYIRIIDNVDHLSLRELMSEHNVYVHTHLVTGLSNTMLEAIACGLPVVSFYSDIASYNIEDLSNVIKECPRYNYVDLARMITEVNILEPISENARKKILKEFSLEEQVGKFDEFFS